MRSPGLFAICRATKDSKRNVKYLSIPVKMFRTTVLSLSGLSLGSAYTFRVWRGPMGWATPCTLGEGVTFGQLTVTAGELGNCQAITDITAGGSASYIVTK